MTHHVTSIEQLETLYGQAMPTSIGKETDTINPYYRKLIESAPFFAIASCGEKGLDVSPRGDPAGFVRILDRHTIAVPDRRGNNRLDTLRNIVKNPSVALLFLVPGLEMTLRYNGRAHLSIEPVLLESFSVDGKPPASVIVVELDTLFFQCARALKRAKLWDASMQVDPKDMPTAGQLAKSVMPNFDAEGYDEEREERQNNSLY